MRNNSENTQKSITEIPDPTNRRSGLSTAQNIIVVCAGILTFILLISSSYYVGNYIIMVDYYDKGLATAFGFFVVLVSIVFIYVLTAIWKDILYN